MKDSLKIRPIESKDNLLMKKVIHQVMPEFGAEGDGFAIHDDEVNDLFEAYQKPQCIYYVIEYHSKIIGGAGIAPLKGGDFETAELRKMYFLKEFRGQGIGKKLLSLLIKKAKECGFKRIYLETMPEMKSANFLYQSLGFEKRNSPLGNTGHFGCQSWYEKWI
ncbi:MAG: GNAT family N-acetyltransferase [Bdellovibrionaceae bacterium]|nr:GNAT family N-acetyltransferase [Pseudobdellovibrionaceae bacterium]|tara:strand:- start:855 stop:1343 length:489 start_codon:yes stop_codon:yes gene_type:complete